MVIICDLRLNMKKFGSFVDSIFYIPLMSQLFCLDRNRPVSHPASICAFRAMPPKYVAPFVVWILTLALSVTPATAGCTSCMYGNVYYGSCDGILQKSSCWQGGYCCAESSSDCCELNGGALAGIIIAILVALIGGIVACCACCSCCPCYKNLCCYKEPPAAPQTTPNPVVYAPAPAPGMVVAQPCA